MKQSHCDPCSNDCNNKNDDDLEAIHDDGALDGFGVPSPPYQHPGRVSTWPATEDVLVELLLDALVGALAGATLTLIVGLIIPSTVAGIGMANAVLAGAIFGFGATVIDRLWDEIRGRRG